MLPEQSAAVQALVNWLLDLESRKQSVAEMALGLATRLVDCGVPISVLSTSQQAYQPEVAVRNIRWTREGGVVERSYDHKKVDGPSYLDSPLRASRDSGEALRVSLRGPVDQIPFPVCRELAEAGNTDYFVKAMPRDVSTYLSVSTDHAEGFSDENLEVLKAIMPAIMLRLELYCSHYALSSLLHLYLGGNAAERVIQGEFRLGGTADIHAVVWMCDLRGFTSLSEKNAPGDVLVALNQYFSCVVTSVQEHGGEILKFIGDAVLAIFPVADDERGACQRALLAARQAFAALDITNQSRQEQGQELLQFGLALNLGRAFYGNIGTPTRLDFTVIGPTVNEAARIESLCSSLGHRLLVSKSFADSVENADLVSVGRHSLKGVADARELFTIESL